jgi:acetyl esterase
MRRLLLSFFAAILFVAVASAADAPKIIQKKDVIYGVVEGSGLLADLAWPEAKSQLPVVVIVHGGQWRSGSKSDSYYARQSVFATAGFFTMVIDYRLIDATPAPACYQDLFTAIRWLHAHATQYHIDANRIYLIGNSSGGHEVALAAALGQGPYPRTGGWDKAESGIAGAVAFSGAYDLNSISWGNLWTPLTGNPDKGFASMTGAALQQARRAASPLFNVSPQSKPILFFHSEDDTVVPFQQAVAFDKALTDAHVFHKFLRYKDRGHMGFEDDNIREAISFITELETRR